MAASQIPRPPAGLATRGRALWRSVNQRYELDALEAELLLEACRVADRCDQIAAELKGQPLLTSGSVGQPRVNPLLGALEQQQKLLDRLCGSLGISTPGVSGAGKARSHQRKAAVTKWRNAKAAGSVSSIVGA